MVLLLEFAAGAWGKYRRRRLGWRVEVCSALLSPEAGLKGWASSSGLPQVRFLCGVTEVIRADRWTVQATGGQFLSRQQLPLQLAWAISIHKSQVSSQCGRWGQGRAEGEWDRPEGDS